MLEFLASDLISNLFVNILLIFLTIALGFSIIIVLYLSIKGIIDEISRWGGDEKRNIKK